MDILSSKDLPLNWRDRIILPNHFFKKLSIEKSVFEPTWQESYFCTALELPHENHEPSKDDLLIFLTRSEFLNFFKKYQTSYSSAIFLVYDGEESKYAGFVYPPLSTYEVILNMFCKNIGTTRFN